MFRKTFVASIILLASSEALSASSEVPYLGARIGVDTGHWKVRDVSGARTNFSENGVFGGFFAGVGTDLTPQFYLAGEIFGDGSSANTSTKTINTGTVPASVSMRLRYSYGGSIIPGYNINPAALVYLRLGGIRSRFDFHQTVVPSYATSNLSKKTVTGGQLGIGLQGNFSNNWSVRGEYDYTSYRSFNSFGNIICARDNLINVGVLYNFC
ncbi:MAG: outer membrane beta-barrel protein [Gammaproteobacteria bacterium]